MESVEDRRTAIESAFDYRGDVTLTLTDGRTLVGYVSNRNWEDSEPFLEVMTPDWLDPQRVPLDRVSSIAFTGADPAAGKSWENWLKKVAQAEADGKIAELYPEEH
jgi:hypothetical protein